MEEIIQKIKNRRKSAHKGENGHLLVVGGSEKYTGSTVLNTLAAYRSGVDLVTTAVPEVVKDTIASFSPSIIAEPLEGSYLSPENLPTLESLAGKADAVVIGGGIGRKEKTQKLVKKFLEKLEKPVVIDADGIKALEKNEKVLKDQFILTPHRKEFEILTGEKVESKGKIREKAGELGCKILVKGEKDFVTDGEKVLENSAGNPSMTVGGTGDTLAGILGSLIAQGIGIMEAGKAAAYINGRAGELAAEEKTIGLMAEDLIEKIPEVIKKE